MKFTLMTFICALIATAHASEYGSYLDRLSLMQKFVKNKNERAQSQSQRLEAAGAESHFALSSFQRPFFREGEKWVVRTTPFKTPLGAPEIGARIEGQKLLFDFEVTKVDEQGNAHLTIRQRVGQNGTLADARIEQVQLLIDSKFNLIRREIQFRDGRANLAIPVVASESVVGFNGFPIEFPKVSPNDGKFTSMGLEFQLADLYARPVKMVLSANHAWPVYLETSSGISVLLTNGGLEQ